MIGFVHCGDSETTNPAAVENNPVILIEAGGNILPSELTVSSQAILSVLNRDDSPHTLTSQSAFDAFDNNGIFDIVISADSAASLELPQAASGTQFFFYCRFHEGSENPASGIITVE